MSEQFIGERGSRAKALDLAYWRRLSDIAVDTLGSAAAGPVMREVFETGDTEVIFAHIGETLAAELGSMLLSVES